MRVVHVTGYYMPEIGYQEGHLARWHAEFGHEVHVITSNRRYPSKGGYDLFEEVYGERIVAPGVFVDSNGVRVHRLPALCEVNTQMLLRGLPRLLESLSPDLVVAHGFARFETMRISRMRRKGGIPALVVDDHTVNSAYVPSAARRLFYRAWASAWPRFCKFDGIVAITGETKEFLSDHFGVTPSSIDVIPLGSDSNLFVRDEESRARFRTSLGLKDDQVVVVYAGRLAEEKGVHLLVDAAVDVLSANPDAYLLLVGSGSRTVYMRDLTSRLVEAGLEQRFSVRDHVPHEQLVNVFSGSDLAVWPWQETVAALQAMTTGLPVILRDSVVGREWTEGGAGLTWRSRDDLVSAISRLVADDQLREEMGKAAREAVRSRFDWRVISAAFLETAIPNGADTR